MCIRDRYSCGHGRGSLLEILVVIEKNLRPLSFTPGKRRDPKRGFADWWKKTAADRFIKISAAALDHRRFWDAMHALPLDALAGIEERLAATVCTRFGLDTSSVALDMTNFATFIDTGNAKAPIAQRGKAKQKRKDLRLVGLGLVVTRDGGIPLLSHAYPGNKPDVTQFPDMITTLAARHAALTTGAGAPAPVVRAACRAARVVIMSGNWVTSGLLPG